MLGKTRLYNPLFGNVEGTSNSLTAENMRLNQLPAVFGAELEPEPEPMPTSDFTMSKMDQIRVFFIEKEMEKAISLDDLEAVLAAVKSVATGPIDDLKLGMKKGVPTLKFTCNKQKFKHFTQKYFYFVGSAMRKTLFTGLMHSSPFLAEERSTYNGVLTDTKDDGLGKVLYKGKFTLSFGTLWFS